MPITYNIKTDFGAVGNGTTDDAGAFASFNATSRAAQGSDSIILTIPSGTYPFISSHTILSDDAIHYLNNGFALGINNLTVNGSGATLNDSNGMGAGYFLGALGQINDNAHSARTNSINAGGRSVTLKNPAQASLFVPGRWALMTGLDIQGYGFPTNQQFFEYVQIATSSTITGVVTFSAPIVNTYLDTWPLYNAGNSLAIDCGGPATIYYLDPSWNATLVYNGITVNQQGGVTYANGKSVTFNDCSFINTVVPSQNMTVIYNNCNASNCDMEVDKLIDTMSFENGCNWRQIFFQSASVNNFSLDGCTVNSAINGLPRKTSITNSTVASLSIGAYAYGISNSIYAAGSTINSITNGGFVDDGQGAGFENYATIQNGLITYSDIYVPSWAVPGGYFVWGSRFPQQPPVFTVVSVTQDVPGMSGNVFIQTDMPSGFPLPTAPASLIALRTMPVASLTFENCVGCDDVIDLSGAPAGKPMWCYSSRTCNSANNWTTAALPVWGELVEIAISVNTPYSGASNINFNLDGPFILLDNIATVWNPIINPKIAGTRTITQTGTTGLKSGDFITPPGAGAWLVPNQITEKFSSIPGDMGSTSVTVRIRANQAGVAKIALSRKPMSLGIGLGLTTY